MRCLIEMKKFLLILVSLVWIGRCVAAELPFTESQVLGADDTINVVRDNLIKRIKIRALDAAGTFTLSEKTYNSISDEIEEKVRLKSLARVYIKDQKQNLSIKDGQVIVTINAVVQIKELNGQSQPELDANAEKDATIAGLTFQNQILLNRISAAASKHQPVDPEKGLRESGDFSHSAYSVEPLVAGHLMNLQIANTRSQRHAINNFKTMYAGIWSNYSNGLRPSIKAVYQADGDTFIDVDISIPHQIAEDTLRQLELEASLGKHWTRLSELRGQQRGQGERFNEVVGIIGKSTVSLVVEVGKSSTTVPIFGLGQEAFLGDVFSPLQARVDNLTANELAQVNRRFAIGFFTPSKRATNYRVSEGHAIIKMRISESDLLSAPDVRARFVAFDASIK